MLDPKHFEIIFGGSIVNKIEKLTKQLMDEGRDLSSADEWIYHNTYFRGAELVEYSYGWVLRSSNYFLDYTIIAGYEKEWSYDEAYAAAQRWIIGDATNRYVYQKKDNS